LYNKVFDTIDAGCKREVNKYLDLKSNIFSEFLLPCLARWLF